MATQEPRELNEALASRFVVIDMPPISEDYLAKLLRSEFPDLSPAWNHPVLPNHFGTAKKMQKVQKFPQEGTGSPWTARLCPPDKKRACSAGGTASWHRK